MEGAMEDLQDTFIVHTIEEIQVSTEWADRDRGDLIYPRINNSVAMQHAQLWTFMYFKNMLLRITSKSLTFWEICFFAVLS